MGDSNRVTEAGDDTFRAQQVDRFLDEDKDLLEQLSDTRKPQVEQSAAHVAKVSESLNGRLAQD